MSGGHLAAVELLVDRGADLDVQDRVSRWTALMNAAYYGHVNVVKVLIAAGANVALTAHNGCTAFDIASLIGDTELVHLFAATSMRPPTPSRHTAVRQRGEEKGRDGGLSPRTDGSSASLARDRNTPGIFAESPHQGSPVRATIRSGR